jgi:hypothetical protein
MARRGVETRQGHRTLSGCGGIHVSAVHERSNVRSRASHCTVLIGNNNAPHFLVIVGIAKTKNDFLVNDPATGSQRSYFSAYKGRTDELERLLRQCRSWAVRPGSRLFAYRSDARGSSRCDRDVAPRWQRPDCGRHVRPWDRPCHGGGVQALALDQARVGLRAQTLDSSSRPLGARDSRQASARDANSEGSFLQADSLLGLGARHGRGPGLIGLPIKKR